MSNEDFESAIASLEASTVSIEKQCRILEAQKQALQDIQARKAASKQSESIKAQRSTKVVREKAQIELEATELADSLQSQVDRSLKQAESAINNIQPTVERVFEKDDRLLDGLEKALQQISAPAGGSGTSDEVERLCQALVTFSSEEIHSRIDAAYETAVQGDESHTNGSNGHDMVKQRDSLRLELEELCREVDGLSTMAVDAQYRTPISKALKAANSDSENDRALWTEYLSATLQYLTGRLEAMGDEAQNTRSQYNALKAVSTTLKGVLAISVEDKEHAKVSVRSPMKPSQRGLKPLRLVQANLSEPQDPAAQLLRSLDIKTSNSSESTQLAEEIDKVAGDKSDKLLSLANSSEQGISDQVVRSISKADADVQVLLSAVYAYSPYSSISLVNGEGTDGIDGLEQKTRTLGEEMRQSNVDGLMKTIRKKQQALLEQPAA